MRARLVGSGASERFSLSFLELLATNYILTLTTVTTDFFLSLYETATQNPAAINDGPVPFEGAVTMYPALAQTVS